MVDVRLEGVHVVKARLKSGPVAYHYAWRGGPRLSGLPGSAEYIASFNAAHAARKAPSKGVLREIITRYRASPAFAKLGSHTQRAYRKHLDAIEAKWGAMPLAAVNDEKVRTAFVAWRDTMADRPRTADMAVGVLKALLAWGEERVLCQNHAAPIKRLHSVNKSDAIWTADELTAVLKHSSTELRWAIELALHTGLRQSDLIRLAWNHEQDGAFGYLTSKRKRFVTVPITPACRALLGRIERRGPIILTTHRGKRPWTADGLRSSFAEACKPENANVQRTFHDLRRTAATNLLAAGIDGAQVAMLMGWSEDDVEAMKRKYVSRKAVVQAILAKLEKGG
jgi:integrase